MFGMNVKGVIGAVLGAIVGFIVWFGFTALIGIWLSLLGVIIGLAVAGGMLFLNKDEIRRALLSHRILASVVSIVTVIFSEYHINRYMFAKAGEIELSNFSIIPSNIEMFNALFFHDLWWQPLLGILFAIIACNLLLKDSV